jgi:flavin-dependent dehydrogenase
LIIIIGSGLAGIGFSEIALQHNKSILVLDDNSQSSSRIAGGLYNPVILKRFSEVWQAQEQLVVMDKFYGVLENKLKIKVDFKKPILKIFFSIEEQNNFIASGRISFLSTELVTKKYSGIDSPYNYEVLHTGHTALLLEKI